MEINAERSWSLLHKPSSPSHITVFSAWCSNTAGGQVCQLGTVQLNVWILPSECPHQSSSILNLTFPSAILMTMTFHSNVTHGTSFLLPQIQQPHYGCQMGLVPKSPKWMKQPISLVCWTTLFLLVCNQLWTQYVANISKSANRPRQPWTVPKFGHASARCHSQWGQYC